MHSDGGEHEANDGKGEVPRAGTEGERLAELTRKLEGLKRPSAGQAADGGGTSGLAGVGMALRLGSEFVAGVIVGFVLGYTIDRVFGTSPWGMVVFLLLGFAAGTLNVMRAAGVVAEKRPLPGPKNGKGEDGN